MIIHILVSVWGGCIEDAVAHLDKEKAKQEEYGLKKQFGIIEGHEEESEHAVMLFKDVTVNEEKGV